MAMADSNLHVPEALMAELKETADAERTSPDALAKEAIERLLENRKLQEIYAFGEGQARKLGIRERDVPRIVKEMRRKHTGAER
jgi:predicted nucleotidyltransferase